MLMMHFRWLRAWHTAFVIGKYQNSSSDFSVEELCTKQQLQTSPVWADNLKNYLLWLESILNLSICEQLTVLNLSQNPKWACNVIKYQVIGAPEWVWLVHTHLRFGEWAREMLHVVLDICTHRKVFEKENDQICDAEFNKLYINDQYLFWFGCMRFV